MKNSSQGNITIFFSIVLSATILLSVVLNDALKAALISSKMESTVISSSNSVLANYSTSLKEDYGLLALNLNNNDIYSSFSYYLDNNNSNIANPMKYRVSEIKVDPVYNLAEVEVLKNQILQSSKYDAPTGLVKGVLDKMNLLKNGSKASSILNKKMNAERGVSSSSVDNLISDIVGKITSEERDLVNNFNTQAISDMSKSILESEPETGKVDEIIEKLQSCITATQNVLNVVVTLIDKCSELTSAYNEFSGSISAILSEFEISAPSSLPTPSQKIIDMKNSLESNLRFLNRELELAQSGKLEELIGSITTSQYKRALLENDVSGTYNDSRKGIAEAAKKNDKANTNDIVATLPERIATEESVFDDMENKTDFEKEDKGNFSESILNTFSNFDSDKTSNIISDLASGARNKLYIDEYILERFKSATNKLDRASVFDSEVEYIINGDASQNKNVSNVKNEITAVRFVLNTIHIYSDTEKVNLAYEVASAISSWWSFGLAVPIIGTLLIFAWSFAESMSDIDDLTSGKSVPLMKNKTNWKTDLWGAINSKTHSDTSSPLDTTYSDYLRLLLALHSEDEKVLRVGNLIEINLQKKLGSFTLRNCVCGIRAECISTFDCFYIPGQIKKYFAPSIKTLRYTDYF